MRNKYEKYVTNRIDKEIIQVLCLSVPYEYAQDILAYPADETSTILDKIREDVMASSAWETDGCWNEDDIRLAIGRILTDVLKG